MKTYLLKQIMKLGVVLLMGGCAHAGSGVFGVDYISWQEEVLLHDGRKVISERVCHLGSYPTLDSHERRTLDETVTFTLPQSNKPLIWKTDFRDSQPEPNGLNLLMFDVVNDTPYLVTYPAGCIAYNKWARPNPPYIFFKYENERWNRISLAEFPANLSKTNVIVGRPPTSLLKPYYTATQVDERNYYLPAEYKTILRELYLTAAGRCSEMIPTKEGWEGIGFFRYRPSYESCLKYCEKRGVNPKDCPCKTLFKGEK